MTPTTASSCQIMTSNTGRVPTLMSDNNNNPSNLCPEAGPGVYRKRKYTRHQRREVCPGGKFPGGNLYHGATINTHSDDNDLFSDEDEDERGSKKSLSGSPSEMIDDDRRAHHNELERRRRDHIKDHFMALKNSIPLLEGEKSSRALILKRAVDYISLMQAQLKEYKLEMERQNEMLALAKHQAATLKSKAAAIQHQLPSSFSPPKHSGLAPSTYLCGRMQQPSTSPISPPSAFLGALPFPTTTPSILSTSTATNISTSSPSFASLANTNPSPTVNHLTNALSESLRLPTASDSLATTNNNSNTSLTSFLSSLLLQNHPLLSQLQFQQQNHLANNSVITSSPVLSHFGASPAATGIGMSTDNETQLLNSSLLAEATRARLLASTLAQREHQLAAAAVAGTHSSVV